jgi:outer membrane protein assembly factor BamB
VAIAAALVVLAAAGGAWFAFGPGSDGDGDGGGQSLGVHPDTPGGLLWSVDEGDPDRGMVQGMWLVEDALVKAGLNTVTSYDLADGAVKWSIDLEGEHLCVPTTAAADGRVVVGHGENNCGQNITMIDLNSGKQGWSRRLEPQDTPVDFEIAISGTSYAIHTFGGWNLHRIDDGEVIQAARSAYDARKQAVRYIPYGQEPLQIEDGKEICAADGIAGGEILLRRLSCATVVNAAGGSVSDPVFKLQRIDPDDGEVLWSLELPPGKWLDKVHSVDPVIVTFRSSQFEQITDLVYVTDGEITAQFPIEEIGVAKQDAYQVRENLCRGRIVAYNPLDDCGGMAVHDGLLFVTPPGRNNQITALDATTGAFVWAHKTEDFVGQQVVGADEDGVVVFQRGYSGEPSQVVRLSADGEQAEPLFQLGGDHAVYGDYFVHFRDGVLYVSAPDYSLEHDIAAFSADGETEPATEGAESDE